MDELDVFHNKIGQLLVNAAPDDAANIMVNAKLSLDGESCRYEYDYIDADGKENWFVPDGRASHDLRLLLTEMRKFHIDKNMTNGKPAWVECNIAIDIKNNGIKMDFIFPEQ